MAKRKTSTAGASASGKKPAARAAKAEPVKKSDAVYQLKITLRDIQPPIWRRVQVKDCTLSELHEIIQVAMGWENYHLYDFEVGGEHYTDPRGMADLDMEDASRVKLSQVAAEGKAKFRYTYDFGDNWQHEVLVEKVVSPGEGMTYPACIDGKRACPPEDVGGPWGYMEFVEAIRDPEHPHMKEWLGRQFDSEKFSVKANKELRRYF